MGRIGRLLTGGQCQVVSEGWPGLRIESRAGCLGALLGGASNPRAARGRGEEGVGKGAASVEQEARGREEEEKDWVDGGKLVWMGVGEVRRSGVREELGGGG